MAKPGRKPGTPRTGGRQAGTPNKRTKELADRIAARMGEDWCPVVAMAEMSLEPDLKPEIKARLLAEIAPYVRPKLKPQIIDIDKEAHLAKAIATARVQAVSHCGSELSLAELVLLSFAQDST